MNGPSDVSLDVTLDVTLDAVVATLRALTLDGERAIPAVLDALVARLPAGATVVLRRTDGTPAGGLLATAGRPDAGRTLRRVETAATVALPLRVAGRLVGSLTVTGAAPLDAGTDRLVEYVAETLALSLAASAPVVDAARVVLDEDDERAEIAAALHEGAAGSILAARHAVDTGSDQIAVSRVLQQALTELRGVVASLRSRAAHGDLDAALHQLADDLRSTGCRVELVVPRGLRHALSSARAVAAYRTVAAAVGGASGPVSVVVERIAMPFGPGRLELTVTGAYDAVDTGALDRWGRRLSALDGRLERHRDGVTVYLPLSEPTTTTAGAAR